jgi:Family of unknown function (DUF6174)
MQWILLALSTWILVWMPLRNSVQTSSKSNLFNLIDSTQSKGGHVDDLQFDAIVVYPTQMNLDPIPNAADDEITTNVPI